MVVESCKYYQRGVEELTTDDSLEETLCGNPNCDLLIGLQKKNISTKIKMGDPNRGTPHPIGGRARCVEVDIKIGKKERILQKKNIILAPEERRNGLETELASLKSEAVEMGIREEE